MVRKKLQLVAMSFFKVTSITICLVVTISGNLLADEDVRGRGYDSITGEFREECVKVEKMNIDGRGICSSTTYGQFMEVHDYQHLVDVFGIPRKILSKVSDRQSLEDIKLSDKEKFFSEIEYDSSHKYFVFRLDAMAYAKGIRNARLKDEYRDLLKEGGKEGREEFRRRCGDRFIALTGQGMELYYLVKVKMDNKEYREYFKNNVEPKFYGHKNIEDIKKTINELSLEKGVEVSMFIEGDFKDPNYEGEYSDGIERFLSYKQILESLGSDGYGEIIQMESDPYKYADNYPRIKE